MQSIRVVKARVSKNNIENHRILPREHGIKRRQIPKSVITILEQLHAAGFEAYAVGGCIRDLVANLSPKDFDVATSATPEQIKSVFRRCRLIGRRFRLAHVRIGRDVIEVATFRGHCDGDRDEREINEGRIIYDNVFGAVDEDAHRRDFTINALFLDIRDMSIIDYVGGYQDLVSQTIRTIGDPSTRYQEDPVRMLRAVRFASKLGFEIEQDTLEPVSRLAYLLEGIPPARLFDECLKLFMTGSAANCLQMLRHHLLLSYLFPSLIRVLDGKHAGAFWPMLIEGMQNTDLRVSQDKPITPAFLFATLLWPVLESEKSRRETEPRLSKLPPYERQNLVIEDVFRNQCKIVAIPRRYSAVTREIWQMQGRFKARRGKRAWRLLNHPRFRAAYDFLLLVVLTDESRRDDAEFWTRVQELDYQDVRKTFMSGKLVTQD